ncbi:hypothetical protein [Streptomyces sp. NBC_00872]|uniref:hypothetical protein n=1 Tax=Streptomyces sp. NBC_00872 TaxID=2903686 RepID=UPI00386CA2C7|nr:hypothetical protein OG214_07180 [Streptomyces sp. NBC_00872]
MHLKNGIRADVPARAEIITAEATRRKVLPEIARQSRSYGEDGEDMDLSEWFASSPLVEFRPLI